MLIPTTLFKTVRKSLAKLMFTNGFALNLVWRIILWCVICNNAFNPWNSPIYLNSSVGVFSTHSKFRAQTWSFVQVERNLKLLLVPVWPYSVKLSMGERYYRLAFACAVQLSIKDKSETKTVCNKEQKSLQYPFPLFKAKLIGFCYCSAVAVHFPGVPARAKTAFGVRAIFPESSQRRSPLIDLPLWWPSVSHRRIRNGH